MDIDLNEMITMYIEREKSRINFEFDIRKREILEDFAQFLNDSKDRGWDIADVTKDDIANYYIQAYNNRDWRAEKKIKEVNHFMQFIFGDKWVKKCN